MLLWAEAKSNSNKNGGGHVHAFATSLNFFCLIREARLIEGLQKVGDHPDVAVLEEPGERSTSVGQWHPQIQQNQMIWMQLMWSNQPHVYSRSRHYAFLQKDECPK